MEKLASSWESDFREWIIREKFDGDVDAADAHKRNLVNKELQRKQRQQALNGLLIFR